MGYPLRPDESKTQTPTVLTDLRAAESFVSPAFDSFLMLQNIHFQQHCLTRRSREGR